MPRPGSARTPIASLSIHSVVLSWNVGERSAERSTSARLGPGDRHDDDAARKLYRALPVGQLAGKLLTPDVEVVRRGRRVCRIGAAVAGRESSQIFAAQHRLVVGAHAIDDHVAERSRLRAEVRALIAAHRYRLQRSHAEQANREHENRDQHFDHRKPASAAGEA